MSVGDGVGIKAVVGVGAGLGAAVAVGAGLGEGSVLGPSQAAANAATTKAVPSIRQRKSRQLVRGISVAEKTTTATAADELGIEGASREVVELGGLEPPTSSMPLKRSPS